MHNATNQSVEKEEEKNIRKPGPDPRHGPGPELMSAHSLTGNKVCNKNGDKLGRIDNIMLDTRNGKVGYAVLTFGGFLGKGSKLFAVPWNALILDTKNKCFILDVEQDYLKEAPGFNTDRWPDMADPTWSKEVHTFYGTKPYWENPQL